MPFQNFGAVSDELIKKLLLLLLLLMVDARVSSRKRGAGLDDDAGSGILGQRSVRWTHRDRDAEFAQGLALVHASGRRNVRVVAANGYANVAICTNQIIGRVECNPAQAGDQSLYPGVRCSFQGAILLRLDVAVKEIAADIPAGDLERAQKRDHDVR